MDKVIAILFVGLVGIAGVLGLSLLLSLPLMIAWNYVVPDLFGLHSIGWLQAWALGFVASSLVKTSVSK